ncbi:MAG: FecR domain-containing protein [Leptospirales bacterium]|nr:FecR domain-containing protein [Leptospirales bacterium]
MKLLTITSIAIVSMATLGSCKKADNKTGGLIVSLRGTAEVEHAGARKPVKIGDQFESGDTVYTGADSVAVIAIRGTLAQAEVQPNASFMITSTGADTDVKLDKGNMWLSVAKRASNEKFTVHTPTAVAGVRGTKFYTAQQEDITVVCHCEGDVEFASGKDYNAVHHTDTVVFTKNGKTVTIDAAELKGIVYSHAHSMLEDSPLGTKGQMSEETKKKVFAIAQKKFDELK